MKVRTLFPALVVLACVGSGCGHRLARPGVVSGREYRLHASDLELGMTESEVRTLLGPPAATLVRGRRVVHYYRVTYTRGGCDVVLLNLITIARQPRTSHDLKLVFGTDGLERAVYREHGPDLSVESDLLRDGALSPTPPD